MSTVLVTGASGFIGTRLVSHLSNFGYDVFGTTAGEPSDRIIFCDIADVDSVNALFAAVQPQVVIHCAAISTVTWHDKLAYYQINTLGTENLVAAASQLATRTRFLFVSTAGVYGNQAVELLSEDLCPQPVHHYGMSKFCAERVIENYSETVDYTIVRPFNIIGELQNTDFVVPKIVRAFAGGQRQIRLGNIDVYRDYIDVSDCIDIITDLIGNTGSYGEVVNLCSGRASSLQEIINLVQAKAGYEIEIVVADEFVRKNEVWRLLGSPAKLERVLGRELTFVPLSESVGRIYDYYRSGLPAT